jgi:hypothetical protein
MKRGMAIFLPICLVCLFVGCLAVCSGEVAQESATEADSLDSYVVGTGDLEGCPISDGERTLLREPNLYAKSVPCDCANFCQPLLNVHKITSSRRSTILSVSDPPLILLGTLRI